MTSRVVTNEWELGRLCDLLKARRFPFTVSVAQGKNRTGQQNKLQRKWCTEISEQLGDRTPEEVRGYSKLHFGVPILRYENADFAEKYDATIKPLTYEAKLAIMMEPLDLPITRLMTTSQKTRYLDAMFAHWAGLGVILTVPKKEDDQ